MDHEETLFARGVTFSAKNSVGMLRGIKVFIVNTSIVPRRQISDSVPLTESFRAEMNEWMRDFFGVDHVSILRDGEIINADGRGLFMRQSTWDAIRKALKEGGSQK